MSPDFLQIEGGLAKRNSKRCEFLGILDYLGKVQQRL
jgi:hypothetical protein